MLYIFSKTMIERGLATPKKFFRDGSTFRQLVHGVGGCYATDRITVDGCLVGYMYREPPDNNFDSGWHFFAGDESPNYTDEPSNIGFYDVNTIANYDPSITPYLTAACGVAFTQKGNIFVREAGPAQAPLMAADSVACRWCRNLEFCTRLAIQSGRRSSRSGSMSFNSDRRKLLDETLPLGIRASHARSCALHVAQKLGFNREKIIEMVYLETGVDLTSPRQAVELLMALQCLEKLRQQ